MIVIVIVIVVTSIIITAIIIGVSAMNEEQPTRGRHRAECTFFSSQGEGATLTVSPVSETGV
jgi:energy-converting hydrogenase Eha subunit A